MRPTNRAYEVNLEERHWEALKQLPHDSQRDDAIEFLMRYLPSTPTRRIPGKLKQLKGEHRGLYQYSIDRDYRILYTVDETARQVNIEYIGYHPDWTRKSRGGRRIRR